MPPPRRSSLPFLASTGVRLDVTDTQGKVGYARAMFHVHDEALYPPWGIVQFQYASDYDNTSQAEFTVSTGDASLATLPNYGRICCWTETKLDGQLTSACGGWTGREHIQCSANFITKDSLKRSPGSSEVSFAADSILGLLDGITNYSVSLTYEAVPTTLV